jgi:uncharacterized RDD family membrane protein YckC
VVRIGQDYRLGTGDAVRGAVVIMGNATIEGEVDRDVVVILGTATLGPTAIVGDSLVVVGGSANIQEGARVGRDLVVIGGGLDAPSGFSPGGQQVSIGSRLIGGRLDAFAPWLTRGLLWGRPIVPDLPWVWGIVFLIFVVSVVLNALFDRPTFATSEVLREKPLTAFGAGLLVMLLIGPVCLLLMASVVGIAVIPFLICALVIAGIIGKVAVARRLGGSIAAEEPDNRLLGLRAFAIGFAIICVAYVIPVLGFVTWALAGVLGLGAATMAFAAAYRRENPPAPTPAPVAQAMPTSGEVSIGPADAPASTSTNVPPLPPLASAAASFPYARFRDRLAAVVLDVILVLLAVQLIDPREEGRAFFLALLAYHIGLWTWKQTTVGGIICQLRVVPVTGGRLTFADALVRALSSIFSVAVVGLGVLWILRDPERQSWHDKIAGTYVVKVPRNHPL